MYCVGCGAEITRGVNFCGACGWAAPQARASAPLAQGVSAARIDAPIWLLCVIGGMLGGIVGYLTRPSAMFLGQLPFGTVVTGGEGLRGLDQLLIPLARQSLQQMLAGAMAGALLGGIAGAILRRMKAGTS